MASNEHHTWSVLPMLDAGVFVRGRASVARFAKQLSPVNPHITALLVAPDLGLLEALSITPGNTFPADEIMRVAGKVGAAGIVLVHPAAERASDWDLVRVACSALREACRETDTVLLDCLLVSDGQVHSLTGLNRGLGPQQRLADNPWSRRQA